MTGPQICRTAARDASFYRTAVLYRRSAGGRCYGKGVDDIADSEDLRTLGGTFTKR